MGLVNRGIHSGCINYDKGDYKSIEFFEKDKGESFSFVTEIQEIIFLIKGRIRLSGRKTVDAYVEKENILLLPPNNKFIIDIEEKALICIFRINGKVTFCNHLSLTSLYEHEQEFKKKRDFSFSLKFNERIKIYLKLLQICVEDGLNCNYYFQIKQKEFFVLLRSYYPEEDLFYFFYPVLSKDIDFSDMVYTHYEKNQNIEELAGALNYSVSGLRKKFKRAFGIPVSQWINIEKSKRIYHEINCSNKTFMEIAEENGFNSLSYFNKFCKKHFGKSPSDIRKEKR